jgi:hypothetical protein
MAGDCQGALLYLIAVLCLASLAHALGVMPTRRPSVFQVGHYPSRLNIYVRLVLSPVAAACRWSLQLLSPLLSAQPRSSGGKLTRTAGPPGPRTGSGAAELHITRVSP